MPTIINNMKIYYRNQMRLFIFKAGTSYETIRKKVMKTFKIVPEKQHLYHITNGDGYIFEKHLLENYLILYPQPKISFYVQVVFKVPNKHIYKKLKSCGFKISRSKFHCGNCGHQKPDLNAKLENTNFYSPNELLRPALKQPNDNDVFIKPKPKRLRTLLCNASTEPSIAKT